MGMLVTSCLSLAVCLAGCCLLQGTQASSYQICGRQLADLMALVCVDRGGFHAPIVRRSAPLSKRETYYLLRGPQVRRSEVTPGGIVDECCRKTCSYSTLESYCAEPQDSSIQPLLSDEAQMEEVIQQTPQQQTMNGATSSSTQEEPESRNEESISTPRRPNIGLFSRNRPFFYVVSSPIQADVEDLLSDMLQ